MPKRQFGAPIVRHAPMSGTVARHTFAAMNASAQQKTRVQPQSYAPETRWVPTGFFSQLPVIETTAGGW
jgi:hypothetical protein